MTNLKYPEEDKIRRQRRSYPQPNCALVLYQNVTTFNSMSGVSFIPCVAAVVIGLWDTSEPWCALRNSQHQCESSVGRSMVAFVSELCSRVAVSVSLKIPAMIGVTAIATNERFLFWLHQPICRAVHLLTHVF
jgi:hypothetical protein